MFATSRNALRRASKSAIVELLDSRTLMSVTVPSGYTQVDHFTLDAYTLAPQTFNVTGGSDYFFKATGKHTLAQNPTRYADAGSYQPNTTTWTNGTHLHVRSGTAELVNWGAHADDNEYGATYTASGDLTLTAVITDSNRLDNLGSLDLYVYERLDEPAARGGGDEEEPVGRAPSSGIFDAQADPIGGGAADSVSDEILEAF